MLRFLRIATFLYLVLLAIVLAGVEWRSESFWLWHLLLFAPPWIFLLPLAGLTPASALLRQWWLCGLHLGCAILVGFGYSGFHWNAQSAVWDATTLTVVTHNAGQGHRGQFIAFVNAERPDVTLLQDARFRRSAYAARFPGWYVESAGEFVCISRYPIQQRKAITQPNWHGRPVMARFEVYLRGKSVAFYSVHLPTPRLQLTRFLRGRVLIETMEEDDTGPSRRILGYREWVEAQAALSKAIAEALEKEPLPFVVAGDFNMPAHGQGYHRLTRQLRDAFAAAGRGWGYTFPGGARFPWTLFSPWLRIDYIFAGRGWEPIACHREPGNRSQHRAVLARLRMK